MVGAPHGIKGFSKVRSASGETAHLLKLKEAVLCKDGQERTVKVEESQSAGNAVLLRFEGVDTPEKAKALSGSQILATRQHAAPLAKDEYYIEDLKNLPIYTDENTYANGSLIGHVLDIIEGGGSDLVEIKLESGEKKLVPFRKEFFSTIDPAGGKLVLQNLWILD